MTELRDTVTCPEGCTLTFDGPPCPHGVAWFRVSPDYDVIDSGRPVELADFDPSTGHLHDCDVPRTSEQCNHDPDCAALLYAIAQDAELALARVEVVLTEWDAVSKRETGTTQRIRQAMKARP